LEQKFPLKTNIFDFLKAPLVNDKVNGMIDFNKE
jgi:hypothetical protein